MRCRVVTPRMLALLGVVALHLLLFGLLRNAMVMPSSRDAHTAAPQRVTLRLIALLPPPAATTAPPPVPPASLRPTIVRSASARPAARGVMQAPTTVPGENRSPAVIPPSDTSAAAVATAPAPSASGIEQQLPSLLETAASRRAIRETAHAVVEYSKYGSQSERDGPNQRLAEGIKSAGKGDCLKGEFPGAGMGLLSLPFLVAAAVNGDCAK